MRIFSPNMCNLDFRDWIREFCIEGILSMGNLVYGGFCPRGILSKGDFVQGGFCPRDFVQRRFCLGRFCPKTLHTHSQTLINTGRYSHTLQDTPKTLLDTCRHFKILTDTNKYQKYQQILRATHRQSQRHTDNIELVF